MTWRFVHLSRKCNYFSNGLSNLIAKLAYTQEINYRCLPRDKKHDKRVGFPGLLSLPQKPDHPGSRFRISCSKSRRIVVETANASIDR